MSPAHDSMKHLLQRLLAAGVLLAPSGAGSASHLISEMMRIGSGMDAVHVPYRDAKPAVTGLLGGQVRAVGVTLDE